MQKLSWQVPVLLALAAMSARGEPIQFPTRGATPVILKTVDQDSLQGQLIELTPEGGVVLGVGGAEPLRIPLRDVVRVETSIEPAQRNSNDVEVMLAGGGPLIGRIVAGEVGELALETVDLGLLHIPLDHVKRINGANAMSAAHADAVGWLDRQREPTNDRVLLANGDVVQGFVDSVDDHAVLIESALGETKIPYRLVVAIRFSGAISDREEGLYVQVKLRHSGEAAMRDLKWIDHVVVATLDHGARVRFDAERVIRLEVIGGRWEWLSAHRPISFEHTPMLSLFWEFQADRNVRGGPIRVAGERFDRGIGVHSRSSLTYDLKGEYQEFVTSFGIDDRSGSLADVSAFILVDGQRRYVRQGVKRGSLYGPVRLDVSRAKRIELVADYGENGDLQDRFNWVEPALIR